MRATLLFCFVFAAGCAPDFGSGDFRCDEMRGCPDGFECVAGRCVRPGEARDAGERDGGGFDGGGTDGGDTDAGVACGASCDGVCCNGECVRDSTTNDRFCGAACTDCTPDLVCRSGLCGCPMPTRSCGGPCVDTMNDTSHCGGCDMACSAGEACVRGVCSRCVTSLECDDGLACTTDDCDGASGACSSTIDSGWCVIDGACVAAGARDPANDCLACVPIANRTGWTIRSTESCEDGDMCTTGETCSPAGNCNATVVVTCADCRRCDPTTGTCSMNAPMGAACTLPISCGNPGTCNGSGGCLSSCVGLGNTVSGSRTCAGTACVPCGSPGQRCCTDYSAELGTTPRPECLSETCVMVTMTCP